MISQLEALTGGRAKEVASMRSREQRGFGAVAVWFELGAGGPVLVLGNPV